jgi:hypothetical protein
VEDRGGQREPGGEKLRGFGTRAGFPLIYGPAISVRAALFGGRNTPPVPYV